jgi:hypothetical protein
MMMMAVQSSTALVGMQICSGTDAEVRVSKNARASQTQQTNACGTPNQLSLHKSDAGEKLRPW